jgi:actin-related protein
MIPSEFPSTFVNVGSETYVGQAYQLVLTPHYPIESGVITNWDGVEAIWDHIFTQYAEDFIPSESPAILTESPHN